MLKSMLTIGALVSGPISPVANVVAESYPGYITLTNTTPDGIFEVKAIDNFLKEKPTNKLFDIRIKSMLAGNGITIDVSQFSGEYDWFDDQFYMKSFQWNVKYIGNETPNTTLPYPGDAMQLFHAPTQIDGTKNPPSKKYIGRFDLKNSYVKYDSTNKLSEIYILAKTEGLVVNAGFEMQYASFTSKLTGYYKFDYDYDFSIAREGWKQYHLKGEFFINASDGKVKSTLDDDWTKKAGDTKFLK